MTRLVAAFAVRAASSKGEDRAAIIDAGDATVLVVADGAGGMGGGVEAAELVVHQVEQLRPGKHSGEQWCDQLHRLDDMVLRDPVAGETTAVVISIADGTITGASVGDSGAMLFGPAGTQDLTAGQRRKPLIGSGGANPVAFGPVRFIGTLVVASDGLWKYAPPRAIEEAAAWSEPEDLIDLARLPAGDLQDDAAVIVARIDRKG